MLNLRFRRHTHRMTARYESPASTFQFFSTMPPPFHVNIVSFKAQLNACSLFSSLWKSFGVRLMFCLSVLLLQIKYSCSQSLGLILAKAAIDNFHLPSNLA